MAAISYITDSKLRKQSIVTPRKSLPRYNLADIVANAMTGAIFIGALAFIFIKAYT